VVLAAALSLMAVLLGWHGVDQAAQVYRVFQVRQHGLALFDSNWYGGNYPLGYSVVFPVVAAVIGLPAAAVILAVVGTWAFDRLVTGYLGRRPLGSWYFAASTLIQVAIGQLPYMAGQAFGLLAILALTRRRRALAVACGVMAALSSPLAAAFLAMACLAWAWTNRSSRRWPVVTAAVSMVVVLALGAIFPGTGYFPFPWTGLVMTLLFCAVIASPLVRATTAVRIAALLYAASSLLSFVIPNPLGGNAVRLAESVGIPLLACFVTAPEGGLPRLALPRRLPRRLQPSPQVYRYAGVLLIPFIVWQWAPGLHVSADRSSPSSQAGFYTPMVRQVADRHPGPVRVEVVPTARHWEAAYVASSLSLARGWERQLDTADNPLFYTPGLLTPVSYRQWLVANGVSYVALPNAPLDYAGQPEARLLAAGHVAGLRVVWSTSNWRLWEVVGSPGLLSGPGRLTSLASNQVTLTAARAGQLTLRVRYTPYWSVPSGDACLTPGPAPHAWTEVTVSRPEAVTLSESVVPHGVPICGPAARH
jgi:hypothetical protein